MSFLRSLAFATIFAIALGAFAQTGTSTADRPQSSTPASNVDGHMQVLSQRLELTADQQEKIRPIVANFLESRQKVLADTSLTSEQQHQQIQAMHEKAANRVRKFLNDDQKKKLEALEQEHH